ncbi:hypothetical protein [Caulobacter sp. UNC279MFTsu5.1]|uniref:hypothetical protein n=1 Tax=Caulobacter sp. UNC279MFTsu5.1 TaxID=1502775 RepID=UPI0008F0825A|nr:hypothetical protein [Caulobacter sp. UNC279MFTsu5.1]SFJ04341.1 hypothetical protein SAMN02799626_01014 [Caulobacter sp. UNC279MFTsu5.1]
MRGLRTLMLILLAAVFAAGGPLRALPCHAEIVPPCHETAADVGAMAHDKAPIHKSRSDAMPLSCCAGCPPASVRDAAPVLAPGAVVRIAFAPISQAADGLSPAPKHGPPRPHA